VPRQIGAQAARQLVLTCPVDCIELLLYPKSDFSAVKPLLLLLSDLSGPSLLFHLLLALLLPFARGHRVLLCSVSMIVLVYFFQYHATSWLWLELGAGCVCDAALRS
jgi:hypothetical protein